MKYYQSTRILKLLLAAKEKYEDNFSFLVSNTNISHEELDSIHNSVFNNINCLDCANCCITTPAITLSSDIKRISKHLGLSKKQFTRKYIIDDLTGDKVFNHVPCVFLKEDNKCSIYEVRPTACRRFPHTDEPEFIKRPKWNAQNTLVCPAAYLVVEEIKKSKNKIDK